MSKRNMDSSSTTTPESSHRQQREDDDVDEAIRLSLKEQAIEQSRRPSKPAFMSPTSSQPSISLCLSLNNEFTTLDDPKGDTAVYIGPPPELAKRDDHEALYIKNHFDQVHVVHSSALKLMGENSRFTHDDLLGPKSVRSEKRLRKLGVLEQAEARHGGRFKYYIDLRIPTEDEEAAELVTMLTCTKGVLTWHLMHEKYALSPLCVLGHDDFGILPSPIAPESANAKPPVGQSQDNSTGNTSENNPNTDTADDKPPSGTWVQPRAVGAEYSTIRHCSAIERLLNAIVGLDPKLDSAPKFWTFFAVAKHFGCAEHERVSGWITTWIYSDNNINFIQNNPEVSYRVGMGIKSPDLVRDAYSLLVSERALLYASGQSPLGATHSLHGRKFELLDDDEWSRISYAALSFANRFRDEIGDRLRDLSWLCRSHEYKTLSRMVFEDSEAMALVNSTVKFVIDFVRSMICYVLCREHFPFDKLKKNQSSTPTFRLAMDEDYTRVYNDLSLPTRLFTKQFWLALEQTRFEMPLRNDGYAETDRSLLPGGAIFSEALRAFGLEEPSNGLASLSCTALSDRIAAVNRLHYDDREYSAKGKRRVDQSAIFRQPQPDNLESSLPLEALTIVESSEHASRNHELSSQVGSPSKRRKTSEPDQNDGGTPSFVRPSDFLFEQSNNYNQPWLDQEWHRPPGGADAGIQEHMPTLALRPKMDSHDHVHQAKEHVEAGSSRPRSYVVTNASPADREYVLSTGDTPLAEPSTLTDHAPATREESAASFSVARANSPASSNMFFNVWTGKTEDWGLPNTQVARTGLVGHQQAVSCETPGRERSNVLPAASSWDHDGFTRYPVDPDKLLSEISREVSRICTDFLYPPHLFHDTVVLPTDLFDSLLCINAKEIKYLPLWIPNGNDDGSGGVFAEAPLDANEGESFGPGKPRAARSEGDEGYEDVASQAVSTVGKASKLATDGTETIKSLSSISVGESAATETVMVDDSRSTASGVISDNDDDEDDDMYGGDTDPELEFGDSDDAAEDSDGDTVMGDAREETSSNHNPSLEASHDHEEEASGNTHAGTIATSSETGEIAQEEPVDMGGDSSSDDEDDDDDAFEWV